MSQMTEKTEHIHIIFTSHFAKNVDTLKVEIRRGAGFLPP